MIMAGNTVKDMTTNFGKLDKFEGHNFRRWQKKMHFLLTTLKVVYMLTTPMPELMEDAMVEAIRIRQSGRTMTIQMLNRLRSCEIHLNPSTWQRILQAQKSNKGKGKEVVGPSVNMMEEGEKNKDNKQNKGKKCGSKDNNGVETKRITQVLVVRKEGLKTNLKTKVDAITWWINYGATTHVCKDRCWFKTYEPVEDESVLYMGNDHFAPVHEKGSAVLEFSFGKSITLFNVLYVPKHCKNLISGPVLNKCGYKQVYESDKYILSKSGVFVGFGYYNNRMFLLNLNKVPDDFGSVYMSSSTVVNSSLWHARLGHVNYKRMLEMSKVDLIPAIDKNTEKTFVRLSDPKRKTLGEKSIDCIFVGYAEHSKAYRFYVIEPNNSVSINTIIESKDAIFDENRFSSIPRPKDIIPNLDESQRDDHSNDVPSKTPEPRKGNRVRKAKSYGSDFQLYLVEGSKDQIGS
nr:zinc finger, CCHC-type [Tanacetum cinerariifolium]